MQGYHDFKLVAIIIFYYDSECHFTGVAKQMYTVFIPASFTVYFFANGNRPFWALVHHVILQDKKPGTLPGVLLAAVSFFLQRFSHFDPRVCLATFTKKQSQHYFARAVESCLA